MKPSQTEVDAIVQHDIIMKNISNWRKERAQHRADPRWKTAKQIRIEGELKRIHESANVPIVRIRGLQQM